VTLETDMPDEHRRPGAGGEGTAADPVVSDDPSGVSDGADRPGWGPWHVAGVALAVAVVAAFLGAAVWDRVSTPSADSVDVGFLADMRSHHAQAVEMANLAIQTAGDATVRDFAKEVLMFQQYEIGYMEALSEDWGQFPADPERSAMAWMGMGTPVDAMPGMATPEQLDALAEARGSEADALFLQLMTEHHLGGIHMAEHAAERAGDQRVRDLAARMASAQAKEVGEYRRLAERLGVTL
jgi:uncharacterized protein (DUF305 family)